MFAKRGDRTCFYIFLKGRHKNMSGKVWYVFPGIQVGSAVFQVKAVDADTGPLGAVQYEIAADTPDTTRKT